MIKNFKSIICIAPDTENSAFDIEMLQNGLFLCPVCSMPIAPDEKKLGSYPCPNCSALVFYPSMMKGYVLYAPLGYGGLGRVFLAMKCAEPGKKYAVKISNNVFTGETHALKTLLKEAETGLRLGRHPNIVEVLDVNTFNNVVFVVFPLIEGMRLDRIISLTGMLSERKALHIIMQIIDAEVHISGKGFLYRDLKPENIIVEKNGNVRLFDYGLTIEKEKAASAGHGEASDDIEGSPYYIPPERVLGLPESESSEIYSMGMMLFHMLKGEPYFATKGEIEEIVCSHVRDYRNLTVAPELKHCTVKTIRLVDRMIAKIPSFRYQGFASLKNDVADIYYSVSATPTVTLKRSEILKKSNIMQD